MWGWDLSTLLNCFCFALVITTSRLVPDQFDDDLSLDRGLEDKKKGRLV
jgi:hypothetical protein